MTKTLPPIPAPGLPLGQVNSVSPTERRQAYSLVDEYSETLGRLFREAHANYKTHIEWLNSRERKRGGK